MEEQWNLKMIPSSQPQKDSEKIILIFELRSISPSIGLLFT